MVVAAGHRAIVARLDQHICLGGCLLLLGYGGVDGCLCLLLLCTKLDGLHSGERLLLAQLVICLNLLN